MGINFTLAMLTRILSRNIQILFNHHLIYGVVFIIILIISLTIIVIVKTPDSKSQHKMKMFRLEHNHYFDNPKL